MRRLLIPMFMLLVACGAEEAPPEPTPYPPPQPAVEAVAALDRVIAEAAASGKLAMLVLGANWCHDSTDFAAMIAEPELAQWLSEHYVVGLFNLGYLDQMDTYLEPFGVPALYGTPTVLVVDPASGKLLNPVAHYHWRNASLMNAEDVRSYFSEYLIAPEEQVAPSPELAAALSRIDEFEAEQARRISNAYTLLGPLLKQYASGEPPEEFEAMWTSLADMRGQITSDLADLRQSAREQAAAGVNPIALEFPEYSLFSDESSETG